MATLPPEVLAEICQHFEHDKSTLKALRLVTPFLTVEATRYLYKTLLVYQTPDSWKKLRRISQCQRLAQYAEELEVATLEYLPIYSDIKEWRECVWGVSLGAVVSRKGCRYSSYQSWYKGEQEVLSVMDGSFPGLLTYLSNNIGMIELPRLHTIKSLGAHELWPSMPQGLTNRRQRETGVLETLEPDTETCKRMSAHYCFAVQMLHLSVPVGSNIASLELHRYRELLAEQTFDIPPLQRLQNLTLSIPYGPEDDVIGQMWGPWELAHWLRDAKNLQTLRILTQDFEHCDGRAWWNVVQLFIDAAWPKLRHVHFRETFILSESLLEFLRNRIDSLETLCIERPLIGSDDWVPLVNDIEGLFENVACAPEFTNPHPACEDLHISEEDMFTPDLHPDEDIYWEDRDLLGEGSSSSDEEE